jgi:hypothetical protein
VLTLSFAAHTIDPPFSTQLLAFAVATDNPNHNTPINHHAKMDRVDTTRRQS